MALTDTKIADLKQAHGEVWEVDFPAAGFSVAFKRPSSAAFERLMGALTSDKPKLAAHRAFCFDIVVEPTGENLTALLDKYPGIAAKISNQGAYVASAEEAENAKKL
jgi:hypothetical protein